MHNVTVVQPQLNLHWWHGQVNESLPSELFFPLLEFHLFARDHIHPCNLLPGQLESTSALPTLNSKPLYILHQSVSSPLNTVKPWCGLWSLMRSYQMLSSREAQSQHEKGSTRAPEHGPTPKFILYTFHVTTLLLAMASEGV